MTEATPPAANQPPVTENATAPAPKRKKRWWLRILLSLVILLVALVVLLPTIASLGVVRSIVVGKAQAFVPNGKVEVADWSFGWFSPIRVSGVKVLDDKGQVVLEANEVKTDLTLLQAARQKFNLTGTVVDAAAHLVVFPDGSTNLQRLLGSPAPAKPAEPHEPHAEHPQKPQPTAAKLPDVTADITLKLQGDVRLVDASNATQATVRLLPGSGGTVRIADINQPVDADLKLLYDTGENTKPANIGVKAYVDAIENNQIDLANLAAKLDLPIRDVDLAGLSPLLALGGAKDVKLTGQLAGDIGGELKPGQPSAIKGAIAIAGFSAAAPQLKDTYKAARIDLPISLTRTLANGVSRLQLDTGITLPEANVKVAGDVPEPALAKLANYEMPGDTGTLGVTLSADLKKLSAALPNTLRLLPDVTIDKGSLVSNVAVALNPQNIQTHVTTDLSAAGTQAGRPIAIEPINFTSDATLTRLDDPAAGLRDLLVTFTSAFASFNAKGRSVTDISGSGQADLAKAMQQAAQVIDLGKFKVAGQAKFNLASRRPTAEATETDAELGATITGLKVTLPSGAEYAEDKVDLAAAAHAAINGKTTSIDVSKLSLTSAILTASKGDGPLNVDLADGLPRGSGTINVGFDAVQANRLAQIFAPDAKVPKVQAGRFDGKLALASAPGKNGTVGFAGTLGGFSLADTPIQNAAYTIDLNAAVTPAFDHVDAGVRLKGDFFSVVGKDIAIKNAKDVPPQQMVEKAVFEIGVKDLAKAQTVLSALVPGVKLPLDAAGGLLVNTTVSNGALNLDLTASRLTVKNEKGQTFAFDPAKPVTLKLAASIEGKQAVEGLRVTSLSGDFDVATLAMDEPIVVTTLTSSPKATGKITLAGELGRVTPLLAVFQQAEKPMPYAGRFSFTQTVAPAGEAISLKGTGGVTNFAVLDEAGKPSFKEPQVNIANDLSVDLNQQLATITSLTLDMASSRAATVAVNGGVEKWADQRNLKNVVVKVDAVGEKIWPILYAFMQPAQQEQFKDTKLTGPIRIDLTANGSYPAKPTWNESVRTVIAYGGVSVSAIDTMGFAVQKFELPISVVDNGKLITGDMRKKKAERFAKPFTVNGGQGDFGSIVIDIGNPNLPLSIGRKQKILQKVQINPVMAAQLGTLASAIFQDSKEASGELDLTAIDCQNVPLMELMNKRGSATFQYSVHQLHFNGPVPGALAKGLGWGSSGISGEINNATLALKDGIAHQDMTLELAHDNTKAKADDDPKTITETLAFKGGINLASNTFKDYTVSLSKGLIPKAVRSKFADGGTIELRGKVTDTNSLMAQGLVQLIGQGAAQDALDKILGGDKKDGEKGGDSKTDPLDKLLDKLGNKKKDK